MRKFFSGLILTFIFFNIQAQAPKTFSSSDILQIMKKLPVTGSVLYIAAHPDDENTRLLGYLANERKYRTGYLSLTRGDGGQNLIGDEQGIDLGLIRTQELLSARRIDGAEQFFSRAYDFGFSKSPEEALSTWGHDKILSDVVWVIRKFRPDVIITRFPTTGEGGHGHHTASAILAGEAFDAAADPLKFPDQLKYVEVWQATRLLWNTFNFGGNNTTREDQLKIDCGGFNPLLGKSYGEIAAESRSQHKSQGFGVPAQRGSSFEYFASIQGSKPARDIMEGIDTSWSRMGDTRSGMMIKNLVEDYHVDNPSASLPLLLNLYNTLSKLPVTVLLQSKISLVKQLVEACSGLFLEATSSNQLITIGDTARLVMVINNRMGIDVKNATVNISGYSTSFPDLKHNENVIQPIAYYVNPGKPATQPYWLEQPMEKGAFNVRDQQLIGHPQNDPLTVDFSVSILGTNLIFKKPIQYKYTDPVKGEIYQPVQIIEPTFVTSSPGLILFKNDSKETRDLHYVIQANRNFNERIRFSSGNGGRTEILYDSVASFSKGSQRSWDIKLQSNAFANGSASTVNGELSAASIKTSQFYSLRKISYDHIPDVFYNYVEQAKVIKLDLKTAGSRAGYIPGAGDKIPDALVQMGYTVTILSPKDLSAQNLLQFDVIITGVRAYNIHDWLNSSYSVLMDYVNKGGVLFVQYNTNNSNSPVKGSISPYPFNISRNRITDETAKVTFLLPEHPALNFPNKITEKDFDGWIQERSTYHAEEVDSHYAKILSMQDPGERPQDGSLIIADYGKGRFVYSGLVFFRELPAGVPGAYRLFANLIANSTKK